MDDAKFTPEELKSFEILLAAMMDEGARELFETNGASAPIALAKLQALTGWKVLSVLEG
jgi:hypothetical protein